MSYWFLFGALTVNISSPDVEPS